MEDTDNLLAANEGIEAGTLKDGRSVSVSGDGRITITTARQDNHSSGYSFRIPTIDEAEIVNLAVETFHSVETLRNPS